MASSAKTCFYVIVYLVSCMVRDIRSSLAFDDIILVSNRWVCVFCIILTLIKWRKYKNTIAFSSCIDTIVVDEIEIIPCSAILQHINLQMQIVTEFLNISFSLQQHLNHFRRRPLQTPLYSIVINQRFIVSNCLLCCQLSHLRKIPHIEKALYCCCISVMICTRLVCN